MRFPNLRSAGSVRLQRYTHGSRRGAWGGRAPVKRIILGGAVAIVLGSAALSVVVGYVANVPPAARRAASSAGHADPAAVAKLRVVPLPPPASRRRVDPPPASAVAAPVSPSVPDTPARRPDVQSVPPRGRPTAASTSMHASISAEPVIAALERPTTIASRISEATRFHVQVGAFTDRPSAEVIVQRLRALGFAVRLVGDRPFLVWVGGYLDRTTAESLRMHLHAVGIDATLAPG
jgi:cell division septation protein DedD